MKIRAITAGINISLKNQTIQFKRAAQVCHEVRGMFEKQGYEVQTERITTQSWAEYCRNLPNEEIILEIQALEQIVLENDIGFVSIGTVRDPHLVEIIADIISSTQHISASVLVAEKDHPADNNLIQKSAQAMHQISQKTKGGEGNFRFAAIAHCPPDIPFYPAGYHHGRPCFSIALECSDLVSQAFADAHDIADAENELRGILSDHYKKIEKIVQKYARKTKFIYKGLDASPAPSLLEEESLAYAFEKLGIEYFGASGTMMIAGMITRVLKSVPVKQCGYSGLMLPVLEDCGLAQRYSEGKFTLDSLLAFSAVCGTGLDCVPLPGDVPVSRLAAIITDVASLADKLHKPLSARLFPVPGKKAGERTEFQSPYLVDCTIQSVGPSE
ncbi:MAG: DUF711 family protein [candidate division WOR-3 bacterium]|nr:MAG: DUF711 family protein [candidate division WOR-3 bacterium]